ncbi:MAG: hypothetical protein ACI8O8_001214 [Oleiphilaceae bacterium]|jgi:hypothetical protein
MKSASIALQIISGLLGAFSLIFYGEKTQIPHQKIAGLYFTDLGCRQAILISTISINA